MPQQHEALISDLEEQRKSALAEISKRMDEIASLAHDWDSYGSEPPSPAAVRTARTLVREVLNKVPVSAQGSAAPGCILPLSGAGVQIEWYGAGATIEVDISRLGEFSYLFKRGHGSERHSEERHNVSRADLLDLISTVVS
jgi:hypothetical protein